MQGSAGGVDWVAHPLGGIVRGMVVPAFVQGSSEVAVDFESIDIFCPEFAPTAIYPGRQLHRVAGKYHFPRLVNS